MAALDLPKTIPKTTQSFSIDSPKGGFLMKQSTGSTWANPDSSTVKKTSGPEVSKFLSTHCFFAAQTWFHPLLQTWVSLTFLKDLRIGTQWLFNIKL